MTSKDASSGFSPDSTDRQYLVVEDSLEIQDCYANLFKCAGQNVALFSAAREGLEYFIRNQKKIIAVITDGALPDRDGLWLARQIRALNASVPIVLASGDSDTYRIRGGTMVFNAYLEKPFTQSKFNQILSDLPVSLKGSSSPRR